MYNFGNAPSLSEAHKIIAHTHVGRATQLIFGSTPARRKSRADCFFVTLEIDCQIGARRDGRMHAWVKDGIWSAARPAWMVINGRLQSSNKLLAIVDEANFEDASVNLF